MVEQQPQTGESYDDGKYTAGELSLEEIYQAAKSDHENLPKLREREDGWRLFAELLSDINKDVGGELPNVKDSFDSPAGRVYRQHLDTVVRDVTTMASAAEQNKKYTGETVTEVERVWPRIKEIKEDHDLAVDNRNTLASETDPDTGNDGYTQALTDTLEEARTEFGTANTQYADSTGHTIKPYTYDGPQWEGGKPKYPVDEYQHASYPGGDSLTNGGGGGNSGGSTGSSSSTPSPGSSSPDLQTPGTTPTAPATPAPTTPTGPTGPTGPGPVGPVMGGPPTSNPGGTRPVTPQPSNTRPTTGTPQPARGTPGPGNSSRPTTPQTGRNMPSSGAGRGGGGKNSMLPNQRQAAAGRNPVTGSMRGNNSTGRPGANGSPRTGANGSSRPANGQPANGRGQSPAAGRKSVVGRGQQPTGRGAGGKTPAAGRGGTIRPNKGFEETVYRNTRAQRSTVPGVVRGARQTGPELASKGGPNPSRVGAAGKVIGERKNKGKKQSQPEYRKGSLTGTGVSKRDTSYTWSRSKPLPSTEPPTGSVAMNRRAVVKPLSAAEEKRRKWKDRREARRKIYEGKNNETQPETDLFGGYEGRVVPGVIRSTPYPERVDSKDAGNRFSTYGWEER